MNTFFFQKRAFFHALRRIPSAIFFSLLKIAIKVTIQCATSMQLPLFIVVFNQLYAQF